MIRRLLLGGLAALMLAGHAMAANVTPVDVDNATPLFSVDSQMFSGSISSAGTIVTLNTTGYGYIEFQFPSAGAGNSVVVESSNDGTPGAGSTFVSSISQNATVAGAWASSQNINATSIYAAPVTGATMRFRVSVYGSGTVTLAGTLKRGPVPPPVLASLTVTGSVASGVADSGSPVKVAGKYNAAAPTFADGQRGDAQLNSHGGLIVGFGGTAVGQNPTGVAAPQFAYDLGGNGRPLGVAPYIYNGTSYDAPRTAQGADGTGLGVPAVEEGGRSFSEITTATTTAVRSGAITVHTVNVNTCVSAATVKLYNALTATGTPITITCPASTAALPTFTYDAYFGTGLTVVTSGATDVTVTYR